MWKAFIVSRQTRNRGAVLTLAAILFEPEVRFGSVVCTIDGATTQSCW